MAKAKKRISDTNDGMKTRQIKMLGKLFDLAEVVLTDWSFHGLPSILFFIPLIDDSGILLTHMQHLAHIFGLLQLLSGFFLYLTVCL